VLVKIVHPKADSISIQDTPFHYCTPGRSSEIAFFLRGDFVEEALEPFLAYADRPVDGMRVYSYVPNTLIDAFIEENGVR
jgi:hypothetical protein